MGALGLVIDESRKTSVRSLYDERLSIFPDALPIGDLLPLSVSVVDRIKSQWSSRIFTPQSLAGVTFRAAIGNFSQNDGTLPVTGKLTLTFTAADNSTQTTSEIAVSDDNGLSGSDLELALNALSKVLAVGGVTVDQVGSDDLMQYAVTFNNVGAQNLLTGFAGNLFPISSIDVERAVTGNNTTREVQILRIVPNAVALAVINTVSAGAGIAITQLQAGGAGVNQQYRIKMTGDIYSGSWTLSKTTGTTGTTAGIGFDDTEGQIRAKLEATTGIGAGNVAVMQEDENQWLIEFIGALANTAITATVSGVKLLVIPALTGSLDLRTPAAELLLNGSESRVVTFEIEKLVGSAAAIKILQRSVLLSKPAIDLGMFTPTVPAASGSSLFGSSPNIVVNSSGTTILAPGLSYAQWVQRVIAQAGGGAYTAKFALDNTQPIIGAVFRVPIEIEQSANPTLQFYDASVLGTLLLQLSGDSDNAQYRTAIFVYQDDGHWHWTGFEQ